MEDGAIGDQEEKHWDGAREGWGRLGQLGQLGSSWQCLFWQTLGNQLDPQPWNWGWDGNRNHTEDSWMRRSI